MPDVTKVSTGKPKVGGAVFTASTATTLPTTTSETLDAAFTTGELGYISDAGVVNSNSPETADTKAWGNDIVLSDETGKPDTWKFTMLETMNENVLKAVYGASNVTGTLATGLTVKANTTPQSEYAWVFDMVLRNSGAKRVVLPRAKVTAVGDITYVDGTPSGYEVTLTAYPDSSGNTHYEYIKRT